MGYTIEDKMVRVDIFKPSGKWYDTVEMEWDTYESENELIHEIFHRCMGEQSAGDYIGMTAVCLDPYHKHSVPLMIRISE